MRLSACVMAAILIGGCGSEADDAAVVPAQTGGRAVTVELPPELPEPALQPEAELGKEAPAPPVAEAKAAPQKAEKPEPRVETLQKAVPAPEPPAPGAAEESAEAAQASEPALVPTRLPLSESQIAGTIERIGYECGSVVGADRQEGGGEPVYKINCSSGAAYRGTTRNGRLFFRPWGSPRSRR